MSAILKKASSAILYDIELNQEVTGGAAVCTTCAFLECHWKNCQVI
jgi:hypothetical protein